MKEIHLEFSIQGFHFTPMKVQESFDKRDSLGNKPFFWGSVNFFCGGEKKYLIFFQKIKFDQI